MVAHDYFSARFSKPDGIFILTRQPLLYNHTLIKALYTLIQHIVPGNHVLAFFL